MATIKKRPDTGRWQARYRGPDARERAKDFDRKTDAERWLREQAAKIDRGEWTDPLRGRVTVGDYSEGWLRDKVKLKHSTRTSYGSLLREHVIPTWGDVPLSGVRHEDVGAWVQRMHASGLSASRTRQAYIMLAGVLDLAVKARRIPSNPARGVELPSLPSAGSTGRALEEREVWALADAAGDGRLSILVLAWCGLRFGELAGLRVRNFDALGRVLRVEVTLSRSTADATRERPRRRRPSARCRCRRGWSRNWRRCWRARAPTTTC